MTPEPAQAPRVIDNRRIKLDDISIAEDSGWRELDEERIQELTVAFKNGEFGQTTLGCASVTADQQDKLKTSRHDGRYRLSNGKSTVAALQALAAEYRAAEGTKEGPPWAKGALLEVLACGLRVDVVVYPADDDDNIVAIQGLMHDQDQNKFVATSIEMKVSIVLRQRARVEGGCWELTSKALLQVYGAGKRRTIARWVAAARELDTEVVSHLKHMRQLPHGFIFDNKYFLGRGEEARFKLTTAYAKQALDLAMERIISNPMSAATFQSEFCAVMKYVETWERHMVRTYGSVASAHPAFHRVLRMLRSEPGRQRVWPYLRDRVPLAGKGQTAGVEEVRALVAELDKMKAGTTVGGVTPPEPGSSGTGEGEGSDDALDMDVADGVVGQGEALDFTPASAVRDPVEERATQLAEKEWDHIALHTDPEAFKASLQARVLADHKVIFYIDAPTSKVKVLADFLKMIEGVVPKFSIIVPVGRRFDALSAVMGLVRSLRPPPGQQKLTAFMITFESGTVQNARSFPTYAVYIPCPGPEAAHIPTSVRANGCKAAAHEGLRLRCTNRCCPLRPEAERPQPDAAAPAHAQQELREDDLEGVEGEGAVDTQEECGAQLCGGVSSRPCVMMSRDYHQSRPICSGARFMTALCSSSPAEA